MAMISAGTAKNAVMILRFKTSLPSSGNSEIKFRGTSYAVSLGWSSGGAGLSIMRGSAVLANGSGAYIGPDKYVRLTASESNLSFAQFGNTQPPQSSGAPLVNTTAVDTSYLISGTWQYDNTYFDLISFTSLDASGPNMAIGATKLAGMAIGAQKVVGTATGPTRIF